MLAEINGEAVGYLIGSFSGAFLIPFILGAIFTKKWQYGLMFGILGIVWQFAKLSQPKPEPKPWTENHSNAELREDSLRDNLFFSTPPDAK
jgi:hypothetical protein